MSRSPTMNESRANVEPMRDQIRSQPAVLRALLERREEIADKIAAASGGTARGLRQIWAVGHGDSYFAPLAAADAFRQWTAVPYASMLAAEMAAYPPPGLGDGALVVVLSMSGGVGKSIAAARMARERQARVLAVTNTHGSALAEVAHETILLDITESSAFLSGTVTYTASVLVLLMIAALGGVPTAQAPSAIDVLATGIDGVATALASEAIVREWTATLAAAPVWYILGMGPQQATARYGAAKLVEVADMVAIPNETEEFFHEHHWVVRPGDPVVILAHDVPSRQRAAGAMAHLLELQIPTALIGDAEAVPSGIVRVRLPSVESCVSPLPAAVPLQWTAYWLSRARGLDPNLRSHLRESPRYTVSRKHR